VGTYITVTSGGTCILNYSTPETSEYLASDVYQLKFEITRTAQTMNFVLPKTIALAMKSYSLNATTSSNLPTTYTVNTPATCSVSGSKLNLIKAGNCTVTATQTGGPTIAPVSSTQSISITGVSATAKKLICVSGKKTKVVLSKTCPKGYKPKK
jgi:hypothetical protein